VQIFFVLSGFLITALLIEEHESRGSISFRAFYARRALRLLPALFATLVVTVVYAVASGHDPVGVAKEAAAAALYGDNWYRAFTHSPNTLLAHTWSLSIEEQFYLVWPVALLVALRRSLRLAFWFASSAAIAVAAWRLYYWDSGGELARVYYGFDTRADGLAIGCALALALHLGYASRGARVLQAAFYPALLAIIGALIALSWRQSITYQAGLFVFSVAVAIALYNVLERRTWLSRALEARPVRALGLISYAVYLWHYPVIMTLARYHMHGKAVITLTLSIVLATTSYYLIERPALRLKNRLRRVGPPVTVPTPSF